MLLIVKWVFLLFCFVFFEQKENQRRKTKKITGRVELLLTTVGEVTVLSCATKRQNLIKTMQSDRVQCHSNMVGSSVAVG